MKKVTPPQCRRCRVSMERGTALKNSVIGYPDFPGDTGCEDGCTCSATGPAGLVPCWKCPQCGYSCSMKENE